MSYLSRALQQSGIAVWTDEKLVAGTPSWKNAIEEAIQSAQGVIVLMSPPAKVSEWVERELDYAYVLQRPIYPILIEGSQRDAIPFELINMQFIDARNDLDPAIQQLIRLLVPYQGLNEEIEKKTVRMPRVTSDTSTPSMVKKDYLFPDWLAYLDFYFFEPESELKSVRLRQIGNHSRKILRWYFLEPQKFRRLITLSQNSATRNYHPATTSYIYSWIILSTAWTWPIFYGRGALLLGFIVGYGLPMIIPLTVPYKNRRAFLVSVFNGISLLYFLCVVLFIIFVVSQLLLGASIVIMGQT